MFKAEAVAQTGKAAPALVGTAWYSFTLNEMVAIATLTYIILQVGYLLWRWRNEHRDRKNRDK